MCECKKFTIPWIYTKRKTSYANFPQQQILENMKTLYSLFRKCVLKQRKQKENLQKSIVKKRDFKVVCFKVFKVNVNLNTK